MVAQPKHHPATCDPKGTACPCCVCASTTLTHQQLPSRRLSAVCPCCFFCRLSCHLSFCPPLAAAAGCQAPSLSLLLRYLLHLYQQHTDAAASGSSSSSSRGASRGSSQAQQLAQQAQQLAASKGGKVAQGLLLEGRDEGPLPPDVSGQQPRSTDVQALMAAVGLQRREAEDALKLTGGDVGAALAHQLGRLRLNLAAVDCLVWEYATAR